MMTVKEAFWFLYTRFKDAQISLPHLESSWIIEKFSQITDVERIQNPDIKISKEQLMQIQSALIRRLAGEPLAYILSEVDFYGFRFHVDHNVLIPRPETELLVDWAIDWAGRHPNKSLRIIDLGTGSGCIGLSVLKRCPSAHLVGLDSSAGAIQIAQTNARNLDLIGRVSYFQEDAESWLVRMNDSKNRQHAQFDLVLANPPYIEVEDPRVESHVRQFEPHAALFSGQGGFEHIFKWSLAAAPLLSSQAAMGFEVGDGQAQLVLKHFRDLGIFNKHYVVQDYAKKERIVCGEK